jgi:hypothetical protein
MQNVGKGSKNFQLGLETKQFDNKFGVKRNYGLGRWSDTRVKPPVTLIFTSYVLREVLKFKFIKIFDITLRSVIWVTRRNASCW